LPASKQDTYNGDTRPLLVVDIVSPAQSLTVDGVGVPCARAVVTVVSVSATNATNSLEYISAAPDGTSPDGTVVLAAVELATFRGFYHGDLMNPVLGSWLRRSGWWSRIDPDDALSHGYFSGRLLLEAAVSQFLVPLLPPDLRGRVRRFDDADDNPIQIDPAPDEDRESAAYHFALGSLIVRLGRIEPVTVDVGWIDEMCAKIFPPRGRGWIALYGALYVPALWQDFTLPRDVPERNWATGYRLRRFVDTVVGDCDDELFLAAEMLDQLGHRGVSDQVIEQTLHAVRKVLR
jgi:hypothetical protein